MKIQEMLSPGVKLLLEKRQLEQKTIDGLFAQAKGDYLLHEAPCRVIEILPLHAAGAKLVTHTQHMGEMLLTTLWLADEYAKRR